MFDDLRLPLGDWVEAGVDWITANLAILFDFVKSVITGIYDAIEYVLIEPPELVLILVLAAIAFLVRGWKMALGTVIGLFVIVLVNQWDNAMATLALTIVAAFFALLIAIPLGIWAARNDTVSTIVRPVLDFLQTMPAFVYLIPAIILFNVGVVPGIIATIAFAMAPGVRLTELGIRGVNREIVEAGSAFGASPGRILRQIQLPLALPTIMTGVNQIIMLSLSMVVIAAMVGAGGLGQPIVQSLQRIDIGLGSEAGLSVVILAIFLDRVTNALGSLQDHSPVAKLRARRAAADAPRPAVVEPDMVASPTAETEAAAAGGR
ncbi:glycine betaine/proline transport system permease protein [Agrococcus baldri]|uniref:Glycine betaine/proline transport system permease protein n=1 Tax=Agrococcus baldri TaxID=153730 RepID=A0AA94KYI1_9MICO|nr:proline/glycine betaine ABC transporter permease [Agrococcus baldri]SFR98902.1 glycine betaine/proline transport system permease protein [Agrococcus baldri]